MSYLIAKSLAIHLTLESWMTGWVGVMIMGDSRAFLPVSEYYHHAVSVILKLRLSSLVNGKNDSKIKLEQETRHLGSSPGFSTK